MVKHLLIAALALTLVAPIAAAAVDLARSYADPTGDVEGNDGKPAEAPAVDIVSLASRLDGDRLLLTLQTSAPAPPNLQATFELWMDSDGARMRMITVFASEGSPTSTTLSGSPPRELPDATTISGTMIEVSLPQAEMTAGAECFEMNANILTSHPTRKYVGDSVGWQAYSLDGDCAADGSSPVSTSAPAADAGGQSAASAPVGSEADAPASSADENAPSGASKDTPGAPVAALLVALTLAGILARRS